MYEEIKQLKGKTLELIDVENTQDVIRFQTTKGEVFKMLHIQDCCEDVYLEDVNGDLDDLLGEPLVVAEEVWEEDPNASESGTWTFYKFGTIKGVVTFRWYGESNGYYSESVDIVKDEEYSFI